MSKNMVAGIADTAFYKRKFLVSINLRPDCFQIKTFFANMKLVEINEIRTICQGYTGLSDGPLM